MPKLKENQSVEFRKQFVSDDTKIDADERSVTAIITTDGVDRDREVLLPKGADVEQFSKNPVVLWAHDYVSVPIGKALWLKPGRKKITAKVQFADTEQGEEVFQLFKGGFLNAFSVGFRPTKSHQPTPEDIKKKPEWANVYRVFDEWELLEFSVVPVPANAEALAIAVKSHALELSDETKVVMDIEEVDEVVKCSTWAEPEETSTIVVPMRKQIKVRRPIRLRKHIDPKEVAETVVKLIKGKVS